MDYRREIDGLRALAVLPVILFHAGFETFSGGFVGVDVFFVISGYLITTIIIAELEQGKFSIINFYERRARRILPALFLVMLVCIPFAWFWLLPRDMQDFSQSLVAVTVFASNILFWRESGYFDTAAELKPLLHTWSLAVEEQYYVIFPLFLMFFWRLGKRWIMILLAGVFVASLGLAQWASLAKPTAAFYLLPARGWELLVGAFAAFYLAKTNHSEFSKGLSEIGGWLGVVLILCAILAYDKATPFPGFYAIVPTVGAVLIILFATQQTTVGKFVGNKVFVGVGLISYSAYLWHQPLFAFARHKSLSEPSNFAFSVLVVLSILFAYFSWRYVETPFRSKKWISKTRVFLLGIVFSLFFALVAVFLYSGNGNLSARFSPNEQEVLFLGTRDYKQTMTAFGLGHCFIDYEQTYQVLISSRCVSLDSNPDRDKRRIIVFGDSQAAHLMSGVREFFEPKGYFVEQWTGTSCRAIDFPKNSDRCREFYNYFVSQVLTNLTVEDTVILSSRWIGNFQDQGEDGFLESLESTFALFKSAGVSVFVLGNTPEFHRNPFDLIVKSGAIAVDRSYLKSFDFRRVNKLLEETSGKYGFRFYSPTNVMCKSVDSLECLVKDSGEFLFFDAGHLSVEGSKYVFKQFNLGSSR